MVSGTNRTRTNIAADVKGVIQLYAANAEGKRGGPLE
jgi:hypothetical protein